MLWMLRVELSWLDVCGIQSLQLHRAGPTTVISRSMADGSQSRARDRGVRAEVV